MTRVTGRRAPRPTLPGLVLAAVLLVLAGCHRTPAADPDAAAPAPAAKDPAQDDAGGGVGITLTAGQVQKLAVVTQPARAADYTPETLGFGTVSAHDAIATAVAELATARAAQQQSRAAVARLQRLAGTPGALAADAGEGAVRQAATDDAAVTLAERRLSVVIGGGSGMAGLGPALQDLASGRVKLLRATFPLGALQGAAPVSLRAAHLDGTGGWSLHPVWSAPADASVPGRSFFALLRDSDAGEGERLLVWAPGAGPPQHGVTIAAAALVLSGGRFWCYLEQRPGTFVRHEVTTDKPLGAGYFVSAGIKAGDAVVTAAAGLLLAREMNPSTEAD